MSGDCDGKGGGGNPRLLEPALPACDPGPCSLAERLASTINRARQTNTNLGLRPYRVFSVRRHWSGGEVGRGDVCEVFCRELLPRPKVEFRTRREPTPSGYVERGVVTISEINPQLTEDEVIDLFTCSSKRGDENFVEVVMDARDGQSTRRRLVIVEPPQRQSFAWRVTLRQQDTARARDGSSPYPGKR
jgi:hypothetical protein